MLLHLGRQGKGSTRGMDSGSRRPSVQEVAMGELPRVAAAAAAVPWVVAAAAAVPCVLLLLLLYRGYPAVRWWLLLKQVWSKCGAA